MLNELQNHEIPKNIRNIAAERKIDSEKIFAAMEDSIAKSLVAAYGNAKVSVSINHDSGIINIFELHKVIADEEYGESQTILYEEEEDEDNEDFQYLHRNDNEIPVKPKKVVHYRAMKLSDARKIDAMTRVGDIIPMVIENAWVNLSKSKDLIRTFNRNFSRQVNVLTREQKYDFFLKRVGTIVSATVKRFAKEGYILIYDNSEILLPSDMNFEGNRVEEKLGRGLRSETIGKERFSLDETIQVYIKSVSDDKFAKYQVIASRTHPMFLAELLKQTVPEIRDEQIIIKNIERMPGVKAKVVVHSMDKNLDSVGSCVGVRGVRIKSISEELKGERIDIIEDSNDIIEFVKNAMRPVKPLRIMIDEEEQKITIAVPDQDISSAIGKFGSNTKLLSRLLKMKVAMVSDTVDTEEKLNEFRKLVEDFKIALDVEEIIAQLLVSSGFKSLKAVASSEVSTLMKIEYFDEELAEEIKNRAIEYAEGIYKEKTKDVDQEYINFIRSYVDEDDFVLKLINGGVKTLNDFADLSVDEVFDVIGKHDMDEDEMGEMIIAARKKTGLID
jgi:N utilization substance protein A